MRERHLGREVVASVPDLAQRTGLTATLWSPDRVHANRRDDAIALLEDLNEERVVVGSLDGVAEGPVVKARLAGSGPCLDAATPLIITELP